MKVRCVNNGRDTLLKLGKIYDVKKAAGEYYLIEYKPRLECWYNKRRFEEVKEMEKTFREVIVDIKEGEVWESVQSCFQLKEISCLEGRIRFKFEGVFVDETDSSFNVDTGVGNGQTFKLKRKEYTFEEAFKAYEEGKEIESANKNRIRYKKIDGEYCYNLNTVHGWVYTNSIDIEDIKGKWYIND